MLCCVLLLLLLLLLLPLVRRDRASEAVLVGPEPENTRADPEFIGGAGTKEDPFILAPVEGVRPGQAVTSKESITIDGMSMIDMVLTDLEKGANGDRFGMREARRPKRASQGCFRLNTVRSPSTWCSTTASAGPPRRAASSPAC